MPIPSFRSTASSAWLGTSGFCANGDARSAPRLAGKTAQDDAVTLRRALVAPSLSVEVLSVEAATLEVAAWADLASRSLEPNAFMEPAFCLAAAQHLSLKRRPIFLFVWSAQGDGARRLLAVCPLTQSRLPLARTAAIWFHDLSALGAPLLDRRCAADALGAVLSWLEQRRPAPGALMIRALPAGGPTALLLRDVALSTGRAIRLLDLRQRAILLNRTESAETGLSAISRRKAKELGRQRRRLGELGELRYASATGGDALHRALEAFLLLEAEGWKGTRGTALRMDAGRLAFARAMVKRMGREAKCRIDSLTLSGRPIAMGIVLSSGGRDFFWKTAYAGAYARLSPGVHFVLGLTDAQQRDPNVTLTDSCAAPDHPMIDRLWPARLPVADLLVGVSPGGNWRFRASVAAEILRRRARAALKRTMLALRPRDHR